jgi:hypothetical protein
VHPKLLARGGIQSNHGAARACGGEQDAMDHQWRGFVLIFRPRAERVGLEAPGNFQLAEIAGINLIDWRVSRIPQIAAIARPFSAARARLGGSRRDPTHN